MAGRARYRWVDESGSGLAALMLVATLSVIALSGLLVGTLDWSISRSVEHDIEALAMAESAVEHALFELSTNSKSADDLIRGPDGRSGTTDDGALFDGHEISISPGKVDDGPKTFAKKGPKTPTPIGYYSARIVDNDDGDSAPETDSDATVILVASGRFRGATARLRVTLAFDRPSGWTPPHGILTNNRLSLDDNVELLGPDSRGFSNHTVVALSDRMDGGVLSAGALEIEDDGPMIQGEVLTSDEVAAYETANSGLPTVSVPEIDPSDFRHLAEYTLGADGFVYRPDGTVYFDTNGGNDSWGNWEYEGPGRWRLVNGDVSDGGIFHVEGDVQIAGNGGDASTPIPLTLIADGSIELIDRTFMAAAYPNLLTVSGGDTRINSVGDYYGAVLVHEQLRIQNQAHVYGVLVVEDAADDHGLLGRSTDGTRIDERAVIEANTDITLPIEHFNRPRVVDWYEEH